MKKILAVLLSVLMVCTSCITFVAASDTAGGAPVVDGLFTDSIWQDGWTTVDGVNKGVWQTSSVVNTEVEGFYYDYKLVYDNSNLYLGVKFPIAPNWTDPGNTSSDQTKATNARFWIAKDSMIAPTGSFSGLIDLAYDNAGGATISRCTNFDVNNCTVKGTSGEDYFNIEFKMPVSELGFTEVKPGDYFSFAIGGSDTFPSLETPGYGVINSTSNFVYNDRETYDRFYFDYLDFDYIDNKAADSNVSKGKTYTGTVAERDGWTDNEEKTKLTDGSVGELAKLGGSGPFVGFQAVKNVDYKFTDGAWVAQEPTYEPDERENGNFYNIIDLGESAEEIYKFSAKFGQIAKWGILLPIKVMFYASNDGETYYEMGEAVKGEVTALETDTSKEWADFTYENDVAVTARYIKTVITPADFAEITAPAVEGTETEGDVKTISKTVVTPVSEISVISQDEVFPEFSDVAVNTNGYAFDYVTAENTTYPTGFGNYTANLTDDVAYNAAAYDNNWYGFYYNPPAETNTNEGIGEIKVDLGAEKTVGGFKANIWQPGASGIGIPEITVYGSVNNVDWLNLGTMTNPEGAIGWAVLNLEYELPVRYIRFDVKITNGTFAMLNEIEVLNYINGTTFNVDFANQYEVGYQDTSTWTYNGGESLAGVGDAIYVYTPEYGATIGGSASSTFEWFDVWVVDFDAENSRYYIKSFNPCLWKSDKSDVEIPENGFVIAANGNGGSLIDSSLRAEYAIGAPVYVYNMNMQTLGVKDTMDFKNENTISVFAPIEGIVIDNFGDRTESATIMTRVEGKTTIGEICEITYGESKDYNYHYLAVVDSNNKVIAINHVLGRDTVPSGVKTDIVVPEGGYMLLCHANSSLADSYKAIEVGNEITLYLNNTDLEELAAGKTKTELNNCVFKVTGFDYDTGVTFISDTGVVAPNKALDVLTDGDKVEDATGFANDGIVLFQNKVCKTAGEYPTVELVLALEEAMDINTVNLCFYQEYVSMIGLPKDNKVNISYATDPESFNSLGDYTFEGENVTGKVGVLDVALDLGLTVNAKYIKVSFQYDDGDSKWTEKPVFEFIGLTEFGVSKEARPDLPDGAFTIENFAGYAGGQMTIISRVGDKTTAGEISELCSGVTKDYNYFYLAVVDSNNKVTAINHVLGRKGIPSGVKSNVVVPKGGYLLLCNAGCTTADSFKAIKVGDIITLYNVNLGKLAENSKVVTLEKAGFKVTGFDYDTGVTYISDTGVVAPNKALDVLTDGDKVSNAGNWGTFEGAVLFTNKACTNAEVNPTVDLVLNLDEIKSIDKVVLDFYHCYNVMIGLPKDNKVRLSYSNDGITYTDLGEFTFEGTVEENTFGTIEATFDVEDVEAQYIGISFDIGPSGLTTDGKVVWEFVSLTEVGIDETPVVEEPLKLIEGADATIEGDFLLGLTEGMTIEQIKALFEGEVEVSGVGTGATITAGGKTITIVILGDVKGDGKIDSKDYYFIKRAILGTLDLTDAQMKAACLSEESKLTSKDYLKVKRHILKTYNIFEEK